MNTALVHSDETLDCMNEQTDVIRRFPVAMTTDAPLRLAAEVRAEGVPGMPGNDCSVFFNLEYATGPLFWDAFLYPETGTTPWRTLTYDVRARGVLRVAEMHIRFRRPGKLAVRNVRVETLEPWREDAEVVVAIFGDSTDMTCYLPPDYRLVRRLEHLLRDRFADRRVDVHGLAEGGEYLQRLVESGRLERELRTLPRCDIALIRYGLNDTSQKIEPAAFGQQLHTACNLIYQRFPSAQVVLSTTLPVAKARVYDEQTLTVASARNLPVLRLDELIRLRSAAGDWDWHDGTGHHLGRRRTQNRPDDLSGLKGDIHPNAYGAQMIAEYYFEFIESLVAKRLPKTS